MTTVVIDDNGSPLSIGEICERCAVEEAVIVELVEFGVVEPEEQRVETWTFSVSAYLRICRALRLKRDLGINDPGIALALELLDEIQEMRNDLASMRGRF